MIFIVSVKNNLYQLLLSHLIANSIYGVMVLVNKCLFYVDFEDELELFDNKMIIIVIFWFKVYDSWLISIFF